MPWSPTRDSRHDDWPVASPSLDTVIVTDRPPADGTTSPTCAGNGPLPAIDRRARTARTAIATATAMKTEPWTCPDATSRSPRGLHSSQRPTPGGTGLPHRAHGWVGSTEIGEVGAEAVWVTCRWCHETGANPAPAARPSPPHSDHATCIAGMRRRPEPPYAWDASRVSARCRRRPALNACAPVPVGPRSGRERPSGRHALVVGTSPAADGV